MLENGAKKMHEEVEVEESQERQEIEEMEEEKSDDDEVMTGEFFGVIKQMCAPFLLVIVGLAVIVVLLALISLLIESDFDQKILEFILAFLIGILIIVLLFRRFGNDRR